MDHYSILGVNRNANSDEIKKAWKRVAVECHPDRNPDNKEAEAKFKQAQAAYSILSDPDKRAQYDVELQYGSRIPRTTRRSSWTVNVGFSPDAVWDDFEEVLKATSGARARHVGFRDSMRPGTDFDVSISISLEEAAKGCSKQIQTPSKEKIQCPVCLGKRATKGARVVCSKCMGSGRGLYFNDSAPCENCGGSGDIPKCPCENCSGQGHVVTKRAISVKIPPGIDNNHKLRLSGMGNPGNPPGDLYITIAVAEHPIFRRIGQDLYRDLTIPMDVAMNGGFISVPALNGSRIRVEIPKRIEPGQTMVKVVGAGLKSVTGNQLGHLFVTLQIELPELKTNRAKKLFEELMDEILRR